MNASIFSETLRLSADAIVCRYMAENALERVLCFCLSGETDYQQQLLKNFIAEGLLAILPLPEENGTMWIVYARCDKNDMQEIVRINNYLTVAMGPDKHVRVAVVWRCIHC